MLRPAVVALLLLLTGCGEGPTDEERVEAALLRLSDFPSDEGWVVEPQATDDPAQADFEAAIDTCEQDTDPTVGARSADRDSDSFTRRQFTLVASNASVVADESIRDEVFLALDSMIGCVGSALESALLAGADESTSVKVSAPYSLDISTAAERTEGRAIQLVAESESLVIPTVFLDVVAIEHGPTLLFGAFMHQGDLTLEDEEQILAPAVERLKDL
jgi:hypothetical protein